MLSFLAAYFWLDRGFKEASGNILDDILILGQIQD